MCLVENFLNGYPLAQRNAIPEVHQDEWTEVRKTNEIRGTLGQPQWLGEMG